jgi:hypothetical protein
MALGLKGMEFIWHLEFFLVFISGARHKFGGYLTLGLTPLITQTKLMYRTSHTLINSRQILLNQLLTQFGSLKPRSEISNILYKHGILIDSMDKLTLERHTDLTRR